MESPQQKQYSRLLAIAEAGGIMPLVTLLSNGTTQARENAAGALWHLALEEANQGAIAKCNGISPLVTVLDDGTERAHKHAADALARLAVKNPDNQAQIAKHAVALLGNQSTGAQQRAAQVPRRARGSAVRPPSPLPLPLPLPFSLSHERPASRPLPCSLSLTSGLCLSASRCCATWRAPSATRPS